MTIKYIILIFETHITLVIIIALCQLLGILKESFSNTFRE